ARATGLASLTARVAIHMAAPPPPVLSGARLRAARTAWLVLACTSLVALVSLGPARMAQLRGLAGDNHAALLALGLNDRVFLGYMAALDAALVSVFSAVGLVIFWRRSSDPLGLLISVGLIMNGVCLTRSDEVVAAAGAPWQGLGTVLMVLANS